MKFILLLICVTGVRSDGNSSVKAVAVAGSRLLLVSQTRTKEDGCLVLWKFQPFNSVQEGIIFNGYNISKNQHGFYITQERGGEFDLKKDKIQLQDAGIYSCIRRIANQNSYRTAPQNTVELTILAYGPMCETKGKHQMIIEGDRLSFWCYVNYTGNCVPDMVWSRSDGKIVNFSNIHTSNSFPRVFISEVAQEATSGDHNVTFFCRIHFGQSIFVNQTVDLSSDMKSVEYSHKWNLTLNILFGPKNISISPRKIYYDNENIVCSALGNPPPTYSWVGSEVADTVNGSVFSTSHITNSFKEAVLTCVAENIVNGQKKLASDIIVIKIRGLKSIDVISIVFGTLGIILFIILFIVCKKKLRQGNSAVGLETDSRKS